MIDSPLLYVKEDGTQAFVHDNLQYFYLAKSFVHEIGTGRVPAADVVGMLKEKYPSAYVRIVEILSTQVSDPDPIIGSLMEIDLESSVDIVLKNDLGKDLGSKIASKLIEEYRSYNESLRKNRLGAEKSKNAEGSTVYITDEESHERRAEYWAREYGKWSLRSAIAAVNLENLEYELGMTDEPPKFRDISLGKRYLKNRKPKITLERHFDD